MPNAIVTGATGILGREIVKELAKNKQQWPTVYALSRNKKEDYPENVKHQHIDLTSSAEDMAKELKHIAAEVVFFAAYLAQDKEDEATRVNGDMLQNFLNALKITGASKKIKRVILTAGGKQYGVHLGQVKNPMEESDKWLDESDKINRPPNFYYRQQNILAKEAKEQGWEWLVTYPDDVIGVAKGNFMNMVSALGLYAAVTKEMGKPFIFPGSPSFYTMFDCFTDATLHAEFNAWAALSSNSAVPNQAFNVVNGDVESWQNLWPKLARKFGLKIPETMFTKDDWEGNLGPDGLSMPLMEKPPYTEFAAERGLKDSHATQQSRVEGKINLSDWVKKSEVKEAWSRLVKKHDLEEDALEKATWIFINFVLGRNYNIVINMGKARKAGWTGYVDNWEAMSARMDELVKEKVLPPF